MTKSKDENYHWIIYHLEAINYGRNKVDKKILQLPSGSKLVKADQKQLRKVISELKKIINDYENYIEYHQQKAMSHIPKTDKTDRAQINREIENISLENVFLRANELENDGAVKNEFKSADKIKIDETIRDNNS